MYDSIEDSETEENQTPHVRGPRRLWVGFGILAGLALLMAAAIFSGSTQRGSMVDIEAKKMERKTYLAAISENSAPLRRARLTDFMETYAQSSRVNAAEAQLAVLTAAEGADWAALTHIVFDTEKTRPEKLSALEDYENRWKINILGGRTEDIKTIRGQLSLNAEDMPDRDLGNGGMPVGAGLQTDSLAGGSNNPNHQSVIEPHFPNESTETPTRLVIPPELRRNATPRYPKRALRAEAEALIILRLFIDERGRVRSTELTFSEADRYKSDFIKAAERAARRLRYHPKTVNGKPVSTSEITKRFKFQVAD